MGDADPSVNHVGPSSSGLTLVLPSLKALKELKAKKRNSPLLEPTSVKKVPRPIKLKPLKEVLTSLISKIKK
jgi:bromodomain-containing protein 7